MHIITGLLVAGLAGMKKKRALHASLPRYSTGPVQTAHWLPGRVRFRVPSLGSREGDRNRLEDILSSIDGVELVEMNFTSGSVLIQYREETVQPGLLFAALVRVLGLDKELEGTPQPAITREMRELFSSLNRAVYETTSGLLDFWSASLILLATLGTKKILAGEGKAFPAGFTLIWWAANSLLDRKAD